ncbi:MAG TPA: hypothetical protein VGH90_14185 [Chthoniobacteraceae bacterium]
MLRVFAKCAAVFGLVWLIVLIWPAGQIRHAPGVLVKDEPIQTMITPFKMAPIKGYEIEAVATYDITFRVLHTKHYFSAWGSDLVPIDVAGSWGRMSDQAVLDKLSISQSNRFYFYEWQGAPPLPPREINAHAANMHLIAGNSDVGRAIRKLRGGQVVRMQGYLVNATKEGGCWRTSLSRTDSGDGACELFYVDQVTDCPTNT